MSLTPEERNRERALVVVLLLDAGELTALLVVGVLSGSLTLFADGLRGVLAEAAEIYAWITMRLIHRGRFAEYEFGTGKIERLVNVVIALSLIGAALWIGYAAIGHLDQEPSASSVFLAMAIFAAASNLVVNVYALASFARANEGSPSIILESQISARAVKALSSFVVFAVVLLAGLVPDPTIGNLLDVVGSAYVSIMMVRTAVEQLRDSVPDLLDRSLTDSTQLAVYGALAEDFERYDDVVAVRSRRSGSEMVVEMELGFGPETTVAEVASVRASLASRIHQALPETAVTVVPTVSRWTDPDAGRDAEDGQGGGTGQR